MRALRGAHLSAADRWAALDWTQAVHLVEWQASGRTFCGLSLERIGPTRWTDSVRRVVEDADMADGTCRACLLRGAALVEAWDEADAAADREECGVDAYNDAMGWGS